MVDNMHHSNHSITKKEEDDKSTTSSHINKIKYPGTACSKVKAKSYRPIILLRRNSCGNISNKPQVAKTTHELSNVKNITDTDKKPVSYPFQNILENIEQPQVKVEPTSELTSFSSANIHKDHNISKTVKTEVIENSSELPWVINHTRQGFVQEHGVQGIWPLKSLPVQPMNVNRLKTSPLLSDGNFLPNGHGNFVKPDHIPIQQGNNAHFSAAFCNAQQYQNTRQMALPVNDGGINAFVSDIAEQFPTVQNPRGRYMFTSVLQNPNNSMEIIMPDSRPIFYQPNSNHNVVSEGTLFEHFASSSQPGVGDVENIAAGHVNNHSNLHFEPQPHTLPSKFGDAVVDDSLTNITWLGRMGVNNFMPVPLERERKCSEKNDKRGRPPYSYMALIQFAINSSTNGRMTLRQIYQWIEEKFPYFKTAKPGWKNSIRHNLSLHDIFVREVTNGSKASYWTLRADLNIRPLTLDSVDSSSQGPIWSLQTCSHGQKPILPRLPHCSRPYILLPVPLLRSNKDVSSTSAPDNVKSADGSENFGNECSSSLLADSGFNSDISQCTPKTTSRNFSLFSSDSGSVMCNNNSASVLKSHGVGSEPSPLLSQNNVIAGSSSKRQRKERLKTLDDSLNSSLRFLKDELNSPPRLPLSPSGEQFLLCKKPVKKFKKKETTLASKSTAVGLSDESFSELLNDLGSPFKSYLTHNTANAYCNSPKYECARKRRRSWGSPESSTSSQDFQHRLKVANETTPISRQFRRVKSDAGDLGPTKSKERLLPTSTPLCENKFIKSSKKRLNCIDPDDNKENNNFTPVKKQGWRGPVDVNVATYMSTPSPIPNSQTDSDIENDFFQDIIGSVFKTPDKPSAPVRHFDSLTPERCPFFDATSSYINEIATPDGISNIQGNSSQESQCGFSLSTPSKEEPLNTSFSKLLDISGGSGSFSRLTSNFPDTSGLNLSWSNLPQF